MSRLSQLRFRAYWLGARARSMKERTLRRVMPWRMRVVPYAWPLFPEMCPCDVDLCDYLKERDVRGRSVFHFGSGSHHLVGRRNLDDALDNDILAITASPEEHRRYVEALLRKPALGAHYKVLFADIYNMNAASLPVCDLMTLFHLCEFAEPPSRRRRLDDAGLLQLVLARVSPGGRLLFYRGSAGYGQARPLIEGAVASGRMTLVEDYRSLRVYRAAS